MLDDPRGAAVEAAPPALGTPGTSGGPAAHSGPPRPRRSGPGGGLRIREFLGRVLTKALEDNIFFMAGAITFNLLVAFVPLILLLIGLGGFAMTRWVGDPGGALLSLVLAALPEVGGDVDLATRVRAALQVLVDERAGFSLVGALTLLWISTRLVGTLRTVLREVFDVAQQRGILAGKLFDAQIVLVGGVLILVNLGITIGLKAAQRSGAVWLGIEGSRLELSQSVSAAILAFASIWILFVLVYRYLPARRIPWRTALVAGTFTGVLFEVSKIAFSWYATAGANWGSIYGNLATVAILFFWIYYVAIVFILGGEVGQVYTMRRARRVETGPGQAQGQAGRLGAALLAGALCLAPVAAGAQDFSDGDGDGVLYSSRVLDRGISFDVPLLATEGRYVLVHLAENRVFLMEGNEAIWSAPAGTGTGFRLSGGGHRWKFSTPKGLMKVRRKEKDPVWEAPDWYYVERGLRIPPDNHPSRRIPGGMGTTALYLGDGIAIHGTNQPQMLLQADPERRRISHGCIRLTNEAARELYHMVDVGTPVLIY